MPVVANTKVAVSFYTFSGSFPPLYYLPNEKSTLNLASINAGNSQGLAVGLGGVNQQFLRDLAAAGQKNADASGKDDYQDRHLKLVAKAGTGGSAFESYQNSDPCVFSYADATQVNTVSGWYEGVCFVDVFSPKLCPEANPMSMAMLYVAPPYGPNYASDADFLSAIKATAVNMIKAVRAYNAMAAQQSLPAIESLRNTLYSSVRYNRNPIVSLDTIARTIYAGFEAELQTDDAGLKELQFPVGTGTQDRLFAPVQDDLTNSTAAGPNVNPAVVNPPVVNPPAVNAPVAAVPDGGHPARPHGKILPQRPVRVLMNVKKGKSPTDKDNVDDDGDAIDMQNMASTTAATSNLNRLNVDGNQGQQNAQQAINNEYGRVDMALAGGQTPPGYTSLPAIAAPRYDNTDAVLNDGDDDNNNQPAGGGAPPVVQMPASEVIEEESSEASEDDLNADPGGGGGGGAGAGAGNQGASRNILRGVLIGLGAIGAVAAVSGVFIWGFVFGGGRKYVKSGVAKLDPEDLTWPKDGDPPVGDLDATVDVNLLGLLNNPVLIDTVEFPQVTPTGAGTCVANMSNHAIFTPTVRTNQSVDVQYVLDATGVPGVKTDPHKLTINFTPTPAVNITNNIDAQGKVSFDFDIPSQYTNFAGKIKLLDDTGVPQNQIPATGTPIWSVTPAKHVTYSPDPKQALPHDSIQYIRLTEWGAPSKSATLFIQLPAPPTPTATAKFVKNDTTTLGDWLPAYGADGFSIAGDTVAKNPSYVTPVLPTQTATYIGVAANDPHALVRGSDPTKRLATAWALTASLVVDLPLTVTTAHQIAIYCADYNSMAGTQNVEIVDAATNTVLDTQTLSNFSTGAYLVWTISGHVQIRITNTKSGSNALLNGIFFGGPRTIVKFENEDTTSSGNWMKLYGTDGYSLAGYSEKDPTYCTPSVTPATPYVWPISGIDTRALQTIADPTAYALGAWNAMANSLTPATILIDLPFTDTIAHQVTIYCCDFDSTIRVQTVEMMDASGTVLDTQMLSSFNKGVYLSWKVSGHVQIRVTNTGGVNGVVSAIFFDTPTNMMMFARATKPAMAAQPVAQAAVAPAAAAFQYPQPIAYDFTVWPIENEATSTTIGHRLKLDFIKHSQIPNYFQSIGLDGTHSSDVFADSGRWYSDWDGSPRAWFLAFQPSYGLPYNRRYSMRYSVEDAIIGWSNTATVTVDYRARVRLLPKAANFLLPADATAGALVACDVLAESSAFFGIDPKSVALVGLRNVLQDNPTSKSYLKTDGKSMRVPGEGIWMVDDNGLIVFQAESALKYPPTAAVYHFNDKNGNTSNDAVILIDPALSDVEKVGPGLAKADDATFWKQYRKCVIDDPGKAQPPLDLVPEQFITITQTLARAVRSAGSVGPNPVADKDFDTNYTTWGGGAWSDLFDTCETMVKVSSTAPQFAARYWRLNMMVRMALKLRAANS